VLILKSEGAADPATRIRVDAAVLKLAKNIDGTVTPGDITYGDAAAAVGCAPETATCKDEVLSTLAVDEIVATTVTPAPTGYKIVVRRASKSGSQEATTTVATNESDHLDGIGPLFGIASTVPPPVTEPAPTTAPAPTAPPPTTSTALPPPTTVPVDVDEHSGRHRWEIAGVAGGGGMMLIGVLLWGAASSTQNDINGASTKTAADLQHLRDLENKGDGQAGLGNVLFIGGVALAAVSGYFLWKDGRQRHSQQAAHIVPTVLPHGAGVAFVIGGSP
jgi:hypothetical protein